MNSTFVFGEFTDNIGLGNATWFAASCLDEPGALRAAEAVNFDSPALVPPAVANADDLLFPEPDTCGTVFLDDVSTLMGTYAFCEPTSADAPAASRGGEVLLCNRPIEARLVRCGGSALVARIDSEADQALHVEHYTTVPEYPTSPITGRPSLIGPKVTEPSGFHRFEGRCEVFLDKISCWGGDGIFAALPFGHQCSGSPDELTGLVCTPGGEALDCPPAAEEPDNEEDSENTPPGDPSALAALPRCPDAVPDGGNDKVRISRRGDGSCADVLFSSDLRAIGGSLLTYSADVEDGDTCSASYEQAWNFNPLKSGSCRSFYVGPGVACLSSCDDDFDCYVSETEQNLEYDDCASAAGVDLRGGGEEEEAGNEEKTGGKSDASRAQWVSLSGVLCRLVAFAFLILLL